MSSNCNILIPHINHSSVLSSAKCCCKFPIILTNLECYLVSIPKSAKIILRLALHNLSISSTLHQISAHSLFPEHLILNLMKWILYEYLSETVSYFLSFCLRWKCESFPQVDRDRSRRISLNHSHTFSWNWKSFQREEYITLMLQINKTFSWALIILNF